MNLKLDQLDRRLIMELIAEREKHLRIARLLSTENIAHKFDVHPNTIKYVVRQERAIDHP